MMVGAGAFGVTAEALTRISSDGLENRARAGAHLLQRTTILCGFTGDDCRADEIHAIALVATLAVLFSVLICAFAFLREDKEELITPLCPSLVVPLPNDMTLTLPKIPTLEVPDETIVVTGSDGLPFCKVVVEWPDSSRLTTGSVAVTVRLQTMVDVTLATVVARSHSVSGQGLALCRGGCDIFGFVVPEDKNRFLVRHRTFIPFLTLEGEFDDNLDVVGFNPAGHQVCQFKMVDGEVKGRIVVHVDAGLVICSLLATRIYQRLHTPPLPAWTIPLPSTPRSAQATEEQRPPPPLYGNPMFPTASSNEGRPPELVCTNPPGAARGQGFVVPGSSGAAATAPEPQLREGFPRHVSGGAPPASRGTGSEPREGFPRHLIAAAPSAFAGAGPAAAQVGDGGSAFHPARFFTSRLGDGEKNV